MAWIGRQPGREGWPELRPKTLLVCTGQHRLITVRGIQPLVEQGDVVQSILSSQSFGPG